IKWNHPLQFFCQWCRNVTEPLRITSSGECETKIRRVHAETIQTPIAPIVHPKINTGKESSRAECARHRSRLHCVTTRRVASTRLGVRPHLISFIAQPRAPLPLRHSECGFYFTRRRP